MLVQNVAEHGSELVKIYSQRGAKEMWITSRFTIDTPGSA